MRWVDTGINQTVMILPMFSGQFKGPWLFKLQEALLELTVKKGGIYFKVGHPSKKLVQALFLPVQCTYSPFTYAPPAASASAPTVSL